MLEWTAVLDLYAELRRIVEALDIAGITYALAGGLAVSIYTTPRATEDIDLLIAADDLERAIHAVESLGFRVAGQSMRVAQGAMAIQRLTKIDGTDLLPLDFLVVTDPTLSSAVAERTGRMLDGQQVWIVSIRALRALKRLRGSALDRADLEALGPDEP